eukprot:5549240-Alexandrium_andersonii.AAC.1
MCIRDRSKTAGPRALSDRAAAAAHFRPRGLRTCRAQRALAWGVRAGPRGLPCGARLRRLRSHSASR